MGYVLYHDNDIGCWGDSDKYRGWCCVWCVFYYRYLVLVCCLRELRVKSKEIFMEKREYYKGKYEKVMK